jgi:hypothetical protein
VKIFWELPIMSPMSYNLRDIFLPNQVTDKMAGPNKPPSHVTRAFVLMFR